MVVVAGTSTGSKQQKQNGGTHYSPGANQADSFKVETDGGPGQNIKRQDLNSEKKGREGGRRNGDEYAGESTDGCRLHGDLHEPRVRIKKVKWSIQPLIGHGDNRMEQPALGLRDVSKCWVTGKEHRVLRCCVSSLTCLIIKGKQRLQAQMQQFYWI